MLRALLLAFVGFSILTSYPIYSESLPPNPKVSSYSQQSFEFDGLEDSDFIYPAISHLESEALVHDVLFFYPDEILEHFNGDREAIANYAQVLVDANNAMLRRQDIALRRKISGIIQIPSDLSYNVNGDISERLDDLRDLYNSSQYEFHTRHESSYVVAITPYISEAEYSIGGARIRDRFSWISPMSPSTDLRTFAHELAHNDGMMHGREPNTTNSDFTRIPNYNSYGFGARCDNYSSIMQTGEGARFEYFFSSPQALNPNDTPCGVSDKADIVRAYQEAVTLYIPHQGAAFTNNIPVPKKTGFVSLTAINTIAEEGFPFELELHWTDAEIGDSVQLLTKKGTANTDDFVSVLETYYYTGNHIETVTLETMDDGDFELEETMTVELVYPYSINLASPHQQELTIESLTPGNAGVIDFDVTEMTVVEGDTVYARLTREGGADGQFTIFIESDGGNADKTDYSPIATELVFGEGETLKSFAIGAISDNEDEGSESLYISLKGPQQLIGERDRLTITINEPEASIPDDVDESSQNSPKSGSSSNFLSVFILILILSLRNTNHYEKKLYAKT